MSPGYGIFSFVQSWENGVVTIATADNFLPFDKLQARITVSADSGAATPPPADGTGAVTVNGVVNEFEIFFVKNDGACLSNEVSVTPQPAATIPISQLPITNPSSAYGSSPNCPLTYELFFWDAITGMWLNYNNAGYEQRKFVPSFDAFSGMMTIGEPAIS